MAEDIKFQEVQLRDVGLRLICWPGMLVNDVGEALFVPRHMEKTVQLVGTIGIAGECTIEGSLGGSVWATLNDPQANALVMTEAKIETIMESVYKIRPHITAGDGTTLLDVYLLIKM